MTYVCLVLHSFSSIGRYLTLQFISSSSTPSFMYKGFSAFLDVGESTAPLFIMASACPGPAVISLPAYSTLQLTTQAPYPTNMDCAVVLSSGNASLAITLTLTSFATRLNSDYLRLNNGQFSSSNSLASLTGNLADLGTTTFVSGGQYMYVRFSSNMYAAPASATGFTATLAVVPSFYMNNSCPGPTLVSTAVFSVLGVTATPPYAGGLNCSVLLYSGNASQSVQLNFSMFNTYSSYDVLTVHDGDGSDDTVLYQNSGYGAVGTAYVAWRGITWRDTS